MSAAKGFFSRLLPSTRQWMRFAISAVTFLVFFLHVSGLFRFGLLTEVESFFYDARLRLTMPGTIDTRVVIVDIDEKSLQEIGHWPWSRDVIADLISKLFDDYWVKSIGFDVLFAEEDESSALALLRDLCASRSDDEAFVNEECERRIPSLMTDQIFAESLIARDVALGYVFDNQLTDGRPKRIGKLPEPLISAQQLAGLAIPFVKAVGYVSSLPVLQDEASMAGFFDSPLQDADGVVRRVPLMQQFEGDLYQSLALALARHSMGDPQPRFVFASADEASRSGIDLEALQLGDLRIRVDQNVAVLVPFRGRQGSFPYVPATDVLSGTADASLLENAIVLVGTSAAGLLDLRVTPVGKVYNGVEVHANIVSGLLDGNFKHRPDYTRAIELFTLFVVGVLLAVAMPFVSPVMAFILLIVLGAIIVAGNLYYWQYHDLVIPLASSVMYLLITSFLHMNYGFFVESRNKRRLSGMFGQYVPPELVDEMDKQDSEISMEGESRDMSVLFSDVRGFTTISEGLEPRELTQFMNEFLSPITEVIHNHRGTIDKYMGDAVMAFWGAPLADPDHARNALLAGMQMIRSMRTLAEDFLARGRPELRIGVGINSGTMNVGNMGSKFRMAYTVLGDAVNLGSRLEGITKNYGVDIIVSEYTAAKVPDFTFRELDRVRVKGKNEPVSILEPLGVTSEVEPADLDELMRYRQAMEYYLAQQWDKAQKEFAALHDEFTHSVYEIYISRIREFRENPPGEDWDGVYTLTSK